MVTGSVCMADAAQFGLHTFLLVVLQKLSQEIPHLLCNPKVCHHVRKCLPLANILS